MFLIAEKKASGRLEFDFPEAYLYYVKKLKSGQRVRVAFTEERKPKSRPLECYYWPVVVKIWADQGLQTRDYYAAHYDLLLRTGERDDEGEIITTSDIRFNIRMQVQYVERCRDLLAERGIYCPEPRQCGYDPKKVLTDLGLIA